MQRLLIIDDDPALVAMLRRAQDGYPVRLVYGDLTLDTTAHLARRGECSIALTNMELRLLREFLTHPEHVLPKEVLLERVWATTSAAPSTSWRCTSSSCGRSLRMTARSASSTRSATPATSSREHEPC